MFPISPYTQVRLHTHTERLGISSACSMFQPAWFSTVLWFETVCAGVRGRNQRKSIAQKPAPFSPSSKTTHTHIQAYNKRRRRMLRVPRCTLVSESVVPVFSPDRVLGIVVCFFIFLCCVVPVLPPRLQRRCGVRVPHYWTLRQKPLEGSEIVLDPTRPGIGSVRLRSGQSFVISCD